jgi:pimeloyl-ACP methyl ester carboxylesterase
MSEKPVLILLPGLPGSGELFKPLVKELRDHFEIDAVSYPQDEPFGYQELVDIVSARIPKEKPYFLLGESFGGPLAILTGSTHRENLQGLILAATFVKSPMPRWINSLKRLVDSPLLDLRPAHFTNERLMGRNCSDDIRRWIHKNMPRIDRRVLAARIRSVLETNVREELKSLQVPVLYLAGANDWLVGRKSLDAVWLCRPDVEVKVIDGVHMILQTNASDAAKAILEFTSRI